MIKKFNGYIPLNERQNIVDKGKEDIIVDKDGSIRDDVIGFVLDPKHYDGRIFFKVYGPGIKAIMRLSHPSIKILLYLLSTMKYSDEVHLDILKCKEFTGYKYNSYIYKGLSELSNCYIIKRIGCLTYQINPHMFYKGSIFKNIKKKK